MKTFLIVYSPHNCMEVVARTKLTLPKEVIDYINNNGGIEALNSFRILFACTPIKAVKTEPYFCIGTSIPGIVEPEYSVENSDYIEIADKERQLALQDGEYGLDGKAFYVANGRIFATLIVNKDNIINNAEVVFDNIVYHNPVSALRSIETCPPSEDYLNSLSEEKREIETLYNDYIVVSE